MKSFAYITNKKIPTYEQLEALQSLWKWLDENVPERWNNNGNVINFHNDEDATLFLLIYTGHENLKVIEV